MSTRAYKTVNANARPYPAYLLPVGGTALGLFAAGYHGWNDVVHFARSDMKITAVDIDTDKLFEMAEIYPSGCEFVAEDAWEFAEKSRAAGRMWDVVSVDPYFDNDAERAWRSLPLWLSLARETLTLTVHTEGDVTVPNGWEGSYFPRNGNVGWLVMLRAD